MCPPSGYYWGSQGGKFYKRGTTKMSFTDARADCQTDGADLAMAKNNEDAEDLRFMLREFSQLNP